MCFLVSISSFFLFSVLFSIYGCFNFYLLCFYFFFCFKLKTAYDMRISDWSSDVCSSDLGFSVVAFDAGPYWRPLEDFTSDETEQAKLYWTDERIVDGNDPIEMGKNNSGKSVGGSTVHFAMVSLRFRPEWFKSRTKLGYGVDWPLDWRDMWRYYTEVEDALKISGPVRYPWGPKRPRYPYRAHPLNAAAAYLARGAEALGIEWTETPLGFAAARGVAVRALPAAARQKRGGVPAQRAQGHRDRALHRPDPAVRAGRRGHGADADQALPAGQCARGGDLGSAVPGARLAARPCLRRGRRGGQPTGAGDRRPGGGAGAGLGGGAVHVSLVRAPRRLAAGASVALDPHASAAGAAGGTACWRGGSAAGGGWWRGPWRRGCTGIAGWRGTPTRCWRERCAGPACIRGWGATRRR